MKINNFLKYKSLSERDNFERTIFANNIHRGRILAIILIGFELILSLIDISALFINIIKLEAANLQLKKLALVDELTGIPNRRSFRKYIDSAFENIFSESSMISFMMVDIDYFKQYNDTYGHSEGNKVIIAVANQIKSIVGYAMDFAARWGGEEFIYLAFNMDIEDIKKVAEKLKSKIDNLHIPYESSKINNYISVSIGVSTIKARGEGDISQGIELADKALYLAKESGRNCVRMLNNQK